MFVDAEVLATGHGIAVFRKSIKGWQSPHEKEQITAEEKKRILDNICRAMEFRKQPVEVL